MNKAGLAAGLSLVLTLILVLGLNAEETRLRPYILGTQRTGGIDHMRLEVMEDLTDAGFDLAGEYRPYQGTHIIVVTSDYLKQAAYLSEHGSFGVAVRVSLTQTADSVQVAYTNPSYMANAYRMSDNLDSISLALETALGKVMDFGSKKGLTVKKLRKYHYVPGGFIPMPMPGFDDIDVLDEYATHEHAVEAVEKGLAAMLGDTEKIYRIDLPKSQAVLFGVALLEGKGSDKTVMETTDTGEYKHSPHLPYEILVEDNKILALRAKFRIAQSFPDLSMGTFMKIVSAPGAIQESLEAVAKAGK